MKKEDFLRMLSEVVTRAQAMQGKLEGVDGDMVPEDLLVEAKAILALLEPVAGPRGARRFPASPSSSMPSAAQVASSKSALSEAIEVLEGLQFIESYLAPLVKAFRPDPEQAEFEAPEVEQTEKKHPEPEPEPEPDPDPDGVSKAESEPFARIAQAFARVAASMRSDK